MININKLNQYDIAMSALLVPSQRVAKNISQEILNRLSVFTIRHVFGEEILKIWMLCWVDYRFTKLHRKGYPGMDHHVHHPLTLTGQMSKLSRKKSGRKTIISTN